MNALATPFRQLVDRKLWPLAILLIAALAAVPMLLAKDEPVPAPPAGAAIANTEVAQSPTQPIVTLGSAADREASRRVLGSRKDPFKPVKVKAAKAAAAKTSTPAETGAAAGGASGAAPAPAAGPALGTGVTGVAPAVTAPRRTYELHSLKIRFGSTSSDHLAKRSIKRLTALPKMAEPTLVYLGLKKDLKTAVFLVDANTLVVGDGKCVPHPTNCQNLELKKGQTAFIDVLNDGGDSIAQYQLDLVQIVKRRTVDAKEARAARRAIAKGGRAALRANIARVNGWLFDAEDGVLVEGK